jgi:WD40 repeat protein
LPEQRAVEHLKVAGESGPQNVETLAFSPKGAYLAAGCATDIFVWEVPGRTLLRKLNGHDNGTRGLAWSADGGNLATAGWDRTLRWWWPTMGDPLQTLQTPEPITCLATHPGGESMAGGGAHRALLFWSHDEVQKKWQQRASVEVPQPIFALTSTRDGAILAAGHADGVISLWDFEKRERIGELSGHEWVVYGLAFTPDGSRLVSGGADGTVRLWDVPHRRHIETYRWHKSWVTCLAVSPDGMTAAAGSDDYTLVLWDLADV